MLTFNSVQKFKLCRILNCNIRWSLINRGSDHYVLCGKIRSQVSDFGQTDGEPSEGWRQNEIYASVEYRKMFTGVQDNIINLVYPMLVSVWWSIKVKEFYHRHLSQSWKNPSRIGRIILRLRKSETNAFEVIDNWLQKNEV